MPINKWHLYECSAEESRTLDETLLLRTPDDVYTPLFRRFSCRMRFRALHRPFSTNLRCCGSPTSSVSRFSSHRAFPCAIWCPLASAAKRSVDLCAALGSHVESSCSWAWRPQSSPTTPLCLLALCFYSGRGCWRSEERKGRVGRCNGCFGCSNNCRRVLLCYDKGASTQTSSSRDCGGLAPSCCPCSRSSNPIPTRSSGNFCS